MTGNKPKVVRWVGSHAVTAVTHHPLTHGPSRKDPRVNRDLNLQGSLTVLLKPSVLTISGGV